MFSLVTFTRWIFSQPIIPSADISHICEQAFLTHLHLTSHIKCIFSQKLICVWISVSLKVVGLAFILRASILFIILNCICYTMKGQINASACTDHLNAHLSSPKHPTALCCPECSSPTQGDVSHTKETLLSQRCSAANPRQLTHVPLGHWGWDYPETTLEGLSRQGFLFSEFWFWCFL